MRRHARTEVDCRVEASRALTLHAGRRPPVQLALNLFSHLFRRFQARQILIGLGVTEAAKATVAPLVISDRFEQVKAAEIGPQAIGDEDLRIRNLPQQKILNALLARRTDHQVWVRHAGRVQRARDAVFFEGVKAAHAQQILNRASAPMRFGREIGQNTPHGVDDLRA